MTPQQFQSEMLRLTAQFPNAYGEERLKIIIRDVQHLDARVWRLAVDEILEGSKFAPMPKEIRAIVGEIRRRQPRVYVEKPISNCSWCTGNGVFSAEKLVDGIEHSFAFRCHCAAGLSDHRCFPRWQTQHAEDFTPVHLKKFVPPSSAKKTFVAPHPLTSGSSSHHENARRVSEPTSIGSVIGKMISTDPSDGGAA